MAHAEPTPVPPTLAHLRRALRAQVDPRRAEQAPRYFQAGPGQYAEGDAFLGVSVPATRAIVRANRTVTLGTCVTLLRSKWHEERLLALLSMVQLHRRGDTAVQQAVFDACMANLRHIDNWDLVDSSAEHLIGTHVPSGDLRLLERLAASGNLWERRIAILSTFHHLRRGEVAPTLHIAQLLLEDPHPLIHKATGWLLREVGERDRPALLAFLDAHWRQMPRTAVRYAIEKFTPRAREQYRTVAKAGRVDSRPG
ncbi:MAG: DNA alkylation repair protein [Gemmatimonadaceae bacterium]|nr:DNA alkylation repair protein [Gemmatimonadaceae bacterium]